MSRNNTGVDLIGDSQTFRLSSVDGEWLIADSYYSNGYGSLARCEVVSLHMQSNSVEWIIEI